MMYSMFSNQKSQKVRQLLLTLFIMVTAVFSLGGFVDLAQGEGSKHHGGPLVVDSNGTAYVVKVETVDGDSSEDSQRYSTLLSISSEGNSTSFTFEDMVSHPVISDDASLLVTKKLPERGSEDDQSTLYILDLPLAQDAILKSALLDERIGSKPVIVNGQIYVITHDVVVDDDDDVVVDDDDVNDRRRPGDEGRGDGGRGDEGRGDDNLSDDDNPDSDDDRNELFGGEPEDVQSYLYIIDKDGTISVKVEL